MRHYRVFNGPGWDGRENERLFSLDTAIVQANSLDEAVKKVEKEWTLRDGVEYFIACTGAESDAVLVRATTSTRLVNARD